MSTEPNTEKTQKVLSIKEEIKLKGSLFIRHILQVIVAMTTINL